VTLGGVTYVVGGYTGTREVPTVLATRDGRTFRVVARLRVTVRYAAVAALDGAIWVVGGEHLHHFLSVVQRIDPTTGTVRFVGRLPHPRGEAVAVAVDGRLLLVGGRTAAATDPAVLVGTPSGGRLTWRRVGSLPVPTADPGAVVVGGSVVVVGGETPARSSAAQALTVRP
jgi:N-acetylneuraminic acid mutarotase